MLCSLLRFLICPTGKTLTLSFHSFAHKSCETISIFTFFNIKIVYIDRLGPFERERERVNKNEKSEARYDMVFYLLNRYYWYKMSIGCYCCIVEMVQRRMRTKKIVLPDRFYVERNTKKKTKHTYKQLFYLHLKSWARHSQRIMSKGCSSNILG